MYFAARGNPIISDYLQKKYNFIFCCSFLHPSKKFEAEYQNLMKIRDLNIQAWGFETLDDRQIHMLYWLCDWSTFISAKENQQHINV
jgi:hypothetical protein